LGTLAITPYTALGIATFSAVMTNNAIGPVRGDVTVNVRFLGFINPVITINSGLLAITSTKNISLSLYSQRNPDLNQMMLWGDLGKVENKVNSVNSWIVFANTVNATLTASAGTKVVYAQLRDKYGTTSNIISASIQLLNLAPTLPINISVGLVNTNNSYQDGRWLLLLGDELTSVSQDLTLILAGQGSSTVAGNRDNFLSSRQPVITGKTASTNAGAQVIVYAQTSALQRTLASAYLGYVPVATGNISASGRFLAFWGSSTLNEGIHDLLFELNYGSGLATASLRAIVDLSAPLLSGFTLNNNPFISTGDAISSQPVIQATLRDSFSGILTSSITVIIDQEQSSAITYNYVSHNATMIFLNNSLTFTVPDTLNALVTHSITITAQDNASTANNVFFKVSNLSVTTVLPGLSPQVLAIPNPFSPNNDGINDFVRITYQLAQASDLKVRIYSMSGYRVWSQDISAGSIGGLLGYNELTWTGNNDFGEQLGNGAYLVHLLDGSGKVFGKCKILLVK
jgi:hypothetical protein